MTYLFLHPIMHLLLFLSRDYLSYIDSLGFLFIFYFSLTKGQCSILSVVAVHRPFYISNCISTLPTQHTTFISITYWPTVTRICICYVFVLFFPSCTMKLSFSLFHTIQAKKELDQYTVLLYGPHTQSVTWYLYNYRITEPPLFVSND